MTCTSFEKGGISILQVSNDKHAFIFDMEKISSELEFSKFFFDLLGNKKITKVNHILMNLLIFIKDRTYY